MRKTAALFVCSSRMGAIAARARPPALKKAGVYGRNIGLLFQVMDDLLDSGQEPDRLTFPGVAGLPTAAQQARRLAASARKAAGGDRRLEEIVEFVAGQADLRRLEDNLVRKPR
jgi:geranylgeranyl pyrophosphate synthase